MKHDTETTARILASKIDAEIRRESEISAGAAAQWSHNLESTARLIADAFSPPTGEAYFIDRDLFLKYVADEVNPARVREGLNPVPDSAASHLFDVVTSRRYRR